MGLQTWMIDRIVEADGDEGYDGWVKVGTPQGASCTTENVEWNHVTRINFHGGHVLFDYLTERTFRGPDRRTLRFIKVYSDTDNLHPVKTISFSYSPVGDDGYDCELQSVTIIGAGTYLFSMSRPPIIRNGFSDFFGHALVGGEGGSPAVAFTRLNLAAGKGFRANGQAYVFQNPLTVDNMGLNPYHTHNADENTFTITYPTGGKTEYLFEHNKFKARDGSPRNISSYRIFKIRHKDRNGGSHNDLRHRLREAFRVSQT